MLTLICPVNRRQGLSPEEFHRHWREVHGPLIRDTPEIARHIDYYAQYPARLADYSNGEPAWDGVAIARYRSQADLDALFNSEVYRNVLRPDEEHLSDMSRVSWLVSDAPKIVIG